MLPLLRVMPLPMPLPLMLGRMLVCLGNPIGFSTGPGTDYFTGATKTDVFTFVISAYAHVGGWLYGLNGRIKLLLPLFLLPLP